MDKGRGLFVAMLQPVVKLYRIDQSVESNLQAKLSSQVRTVSIKQGPEDHLTLQHEDHLTQEPEDHLKNEPEDHLKQEPEDHLDLKHHRERSTASRERASKRYSTLSEERCEMDKGPGRFVAMLQPVVKLYRIAVRSESSQTQLFSCPESYAFTSQDSLHKNMKRSHSDLYCQMLRNGQIPSAACQQITSTAASQKQGDTDETSSYSHQQLTKTLTQPGDVKTHKLTAKGKTPHTCKLCGKSFRYPGVLKKHETVHSGEQPFQCKYCGNSFNDQSNLRRHGLIHTGKKAYHCMQCGKSFSRVDCLKIHKRVHTGEKPFHCEHCDKSFSQLGLLKTHQRLHID